jgi:hypothetical protein
MNIPDIGSKLAINGMISSDDFLSLRITKSAYITDLPIGTGDDYSTYDLDSAEVLVYNNESCIDTLYHYDHAEPDFMDWWDVFPKSNYTSHKLKPTPGKEYRIIVNYPRLPEASSITAIPDLVKIENIDSSRITLAPGSYYDNNIGFKCKIKFSDPGNESNFYLFRMHMYTYYDPYSGDYVPYQSEDVWFTSDDPIIEEKIDHVNGTEALLFSDKLINGKSYSLDVVIKGEFIGNPFVPGNYSSYTVHRKAIYFKLYSITKEYFQYLQTLKQYSKNYGNPLADPILVNSNVIGGYGMFSGAAVSTDSIVF